MSMTIDHDCTPQEQGLQGLMENGEWEQINEMRDDAYTADQTPPKKPADDWVAPAQQFDIDYQHAHHHYQDDNEMPETEREQHTAAHTQAHNDHQRQQPGHP